MRKYTRKTNRPKRGKHGGSLELRGNTYIARWMVNGRRFSETTGETDRKQAEKWLERKLANVRATDIRAKTKKQVETLMQQKAAQLDGAILQAEKTRDAALDELPTIPVKGLEDELRAAVVGKIGEHTLGAYLNNARQFAKWIAENRPDVEDLNQVDEACARQYFDHVAATCRANTYNITRANLSHIWRVVAERYRIKANPWKAVHKMKKDTDVRRTLTREELTRIAATLPGEYRTTFFVGCFTGLRLSDAATLQWDAIDLAAAVITLRPIKTARTTGKWVHLPIVPEFYAILSAIPAGSRNGYVAPMIAERYRTQRAALSQEYTAYFRQAGIETQTKAEEGKAARNVVGFHSLRHTFVSIAANAGIPFAIVQSVVGHSAAKMTAHYFHDNREATSLAFRKFPALFAAAPVPAIENCPGDVIEAEAVVVSCDTKTDAAARRRAALEAALDEIARNGDAEERQAVAAFLEERTREIARA